MKIRKICKTLLAYGNLNWGDVDMENGLLRVKQGKGNETGAFFFISVQPSQATTACLTHVLHE